MKLLASSMVLVLGSCVVGNQQMCVTGPNATSEQQQRATTSPTPTPTPTPTPGSSPSPTPTPALAACVPQTQPFVCAPGAPTLGPIVLAAQASLAWAPEGIYVSNLVAKLNEDPRVCATGGFPLPSDEISVKLRTSNVFSENFDVVNADGTIQLIPAGPTTPTGPANVCKPARF